MKEKITAYLSFSGAIVATIIFIMNWRTLRDADTGEIIILMGFLISSISTLIYVWLTDFGNSIKDEIKKTDRENQLLRKKIEQKELNAKLTSKH
jgi:hypothetical protein